MVELLVTITILAILSAMILFALASAAELGREAKTKSTIAKLNAIVMQKYESYRTRRLPISTAGKQPLPAAVARLDALRELMRMEMPDRWTDVYDGNSALPARPAVSNAYLRALKRYIGASPLPALSDPLYQHQGAECLYLLVTLGLDDSDVMEQFNSNEIGDADGDGFPEFLDGWGQPISFLRWAPGFPSPLQEGIPYKGNQHDPFDPLQVYKTANGDFPNGLYPPLTPLVYSAGPDKKLGIVAENDAPLTAPFHYGTTGPKNNPYEKGIGSSPKYFIGTPDPTTDTYIDNITNHDIETR